MPKDGFYFDTIDYGGWNPDYQPPKFEDLKRASKGWLIKDELLRYLQGRAHSLRKDTDKALVLGSWGWTGMHYVGRLTEFLCLISTDRAYVRDLFALSTEKAIENLRLLWEAIGANVDAIAVCGLDLGTQRSELVSPEAFKELYLPNYREQFAWIHRNTSWKIFKHCDGSITNLISDFVDAGLDALNPVQTSAAGMDPRWLKKTFGGRLAFWGGGVETQSTLQFGSPEQVRAEVEERIRTFAPGGGYVFCPIHNIQPNTPPENIIAAYETAVRVGQYPITQR
jgi:uroporphyrinogen-III decarboxylase